MGFFLKGSSVDKRDGSQASSSNSSTSLAHRAIESFNNKVQSLSTKLPKKAWQEEVTSDDEGEVTNVGLLLLAIQVSLGRTCLWKQD